MRRLVFIAAMFALPISFPLLAQQDKPTNKDKVFRALRVPVDTTVHLRMWSGKNIVKAECSNRKVARIYLDPILAMKVATTQNDDKESIVPVKAVPSVLVLGIVPGITEIELADVEGQRENLLILVQQDKSLLVGDFKLVQIANKKPITKVVNDNQEAARVQVLASDPTTVQIETLAQGTSNITLTDKDGGAETFTIGVAKGSLVVPLGTSVRLQLSTKDPIKEAISVRPSVARIAPLLTKETAVLVTGLSMGVSRITLRSDQKAEDFDVEVRNVLGLPTDIRHQLQMSSGKPIAKVVSDNEKTLRARKLENNPAAVEAETLSEGTSRLVLTDGDGISESFDVQVRAVKVRIRVKETIQVTAGVQTFNDNPRVARISVGTDATVQFITGMEVGAARILIIDDKGKEEVLDIGVEPAKK